MLTAQPQPRVARRPLAIGLPAVALAVAVLALVLALPAGTPGAPSVGDAAQLAQRGPAQGPPAPDPSAPGLRLAQRVGVLYFPNWRRLGWQATGERADRIGGWTATTVFYRHGAITIAYTILTAPALHRPAASPHMLDGIEFDSLHLDRRLVLTWRRDGHTCVLSGRNASTAELLALAAWEPQDAPARVYY